MDKLSALNNILAGIGVRPVTTYESPHPDAIIARQHLKRFNSEIQSRGWWVNKDLDVTLAPSPVDSRILLPSNTLVVNPIDVRDRYVQRGNYLYNTEDNTFVFAGDVRVNLVVELPFEDLPEALQVYITRAATLEFAVVREGDQNKIAAMDRLLLSSRSQAISDELRNGNYNANTNSTSQRILAGFRPAVRRY